ncbi:MAG TPA: hypothetical protein VF202_12255 [Trueperaceae bacterium]
MITALLVLIAAGFLFTLSLCKAAGNADRRIEAMHARAAERR